MPEIQESFLNRIRQILWFSNIGESTEAMPFSACPMSNLEQAIESVSSPEWENVTLEAQNRLTAFLDKKAHDDFQLWNEVADEAKARLVTPITENVWKPLLQTHGMPDEVVFDLQWNILGAVMEHAYRSVSNLDPFFQPLLDVYASGHFPCGWQGEWPMGQLLVL